MYVVSLFCSRRPGHRIVGLLWIYCYLRYACWWARYSYVFIVPKLEWLFWGWLKASSNMLFYQVIAARCLRNSEPHFGIFDLQQKGLISTVQLIEAFPVLFITFLRHLCASEIRRLPTIFSGTAGGLLSESWRGSSDEQRRDLRCQTTLSRTVWRFHGDQYLSENRACSRLSRSIGLPLWTSDDSTFRISEPSSLESTTWSAEAIELPQLEYKPRMPKPNTFFLSSARLLPPESVHDPGRLSKSLYFLDGKLARRHPRRPSQGRHH